MLVGQIIIFDCDKYYARAVKLYRDLHKCAEVGFELDSTVAIVKKELSALGMKSAIKAFVAYVSECK